MSLQAKSKLKVETRRQPGLNQVLIISESNAEFAELKSELLSENFVVHQLSKLPDAIRYLEKEVPEAILIDFTYNEIVGLELCHIIKSSSAFAKSCLIALSSANNEQAEIDAFHAGVDDYVLKPLRVRALAERLKTRIHVPQEVITVQGEYTGASRIKIDKESYSVFVGNDALNLSRKEFELLYLLASRPGKIFTRHEIFEKVWNRKERDIDRTIDVHILRLRKKLGMELIFTQKGVGYKFAV